MRDADRQPYQWMTVRVVPQVARGEFVNVGVVVYAPRSGYLEAGIDFDTRRALALDPTLDVAAVRRHLAAIVELCAGASTAGVNASRAPGERFRWLAAPRSTVVQPSPVHTGLTVDPPRELERLVQVMVRMPTGHRRSSVDPPAAGE